MRVLINGLVATGARTGIGHYTAEMVRGLEALLGPEAIHCFQPDWIGRARGWWSWLRGRSTGPGTGGPAGGWRGVLGNVVRPVGQALCEHRFRRLSRRGFDLYHEPNYIPLHCDLPTVATIHDLSVLLHPEWHPADRVAHFERCFHEGLSRCVHLMAVSEFTRQEIIHRLGVSPDRVTRTYNGCRPHLTRLPSEQVQARLRALDLPSRYLLHLGTIEPRKNLLLLLRAHGSLPESVRMRTPLLLVGGWGWNSAEIRAALDESRGRGVIHLGYVAEEHLPALYNGAQGLVFPSHYEGFGMPAVEMMACGGAVIASTAGALVETVGSKAHLVDPCDLDGWRAALLRLASDDDWRQELRQGVEKVAAPYTWENCALDTLLGYHIALGSASTLERAA